MGGGSLGQAALPSPFSGTSFGQDESKADRRRRKDAERLLETRLLDPWERYRALSDHVDHLLDVTELADRKTRFALVILGALNAVNVLIAIRAPQLGGEALSPVLLQAYITGYVLLSLYAAVFAIIALRPGPRRQTARRCSMSRPACACWPGRRTSTPTRITTRGDRPI